MFDLHKLKTPTYVIFLLIMLSVVLFDGVCNLCDGFVNFVIDWDQKESVCFASLQSDVAAQLISNVEKFQEENSTRSATSTTSPALREVATNLDSIILLVGNDYYTHSEAALRVLCYLRAPLCYLSVLLLIPTPIRNFVRGHSLGHSICYLSCHSQSNYKSLHNIFLLYNRDIVS